jgi:hypothetical protein
VSERTRGFVEKRRPWVCPDEMRRVFRVRAVSSFPLGYYDTQYANRAMPDCRGRVRTDGEGRYGYRAVVPVAYPIPNDVRRHRLRFTNYSAHVSFVRSLFCRK